MAEKRWILCPVCGNKTRKLSGGDLKAVQGDGGWNTPDMVTKRYAHILDEDRKKLSVDMEASFYKSNVKLSKMARLPRFERGAFRLGVEIYAFYAISPIGTQRQKTPTTRDFEGNSYAT